MSGYFEANASHPLTRASDGADTDAAAAAAIFRRLAGALQNNNKGGADDPAPLRADEAARVGIMLARLVDENNDRVRAENAGIGGTGTTSEEDSFRRSLFDQEAATVKSGGIGWTRTTSEEASFRRGLFDQEASGSRAARGSTSARLQPQPQKYQQQRQRRNPVPGEITERQRRWYAEERSILRELVVSTMRHSDGALLRFVPSEEEQVEMWDTHGHPVGERYAPGLVAEGVRISPSVRVIPKWTSGEDGDDETSAAGAGRREDLEFRAGLPAPLLGSGARDAIALCGECGWLCGRVAQYVETVLEDDVDGLQCATARALASRMDEELSGYYERLSLLEGELPPLDLSQAAVRGFPGPPGARYLTLRSLVARIPPIRDHLRTLAILADGVGSCNLRGGKLLAAVLRHSLDGYTRHAALVRSIAADCSVPWYKLLSAWMTQGLLDDAHGEFFVTEVKPSEAGGEVTASLGYFTWHRRYVLVAGLIPLCSCGGVMDIITVDLAREVLLVGKGINFIRHCLQDKDWELVEMKEEEERSSGKDRAMGENCLSYGFTTLKDLAVNDDEMRCVSTLHGAVMKSSARIHSHILESLERHHHMTQHLLALKNFLFLGQGDFVTSFVEGLDQEFRDRTSISGIYSHTLSSVLEGSLRTTNARFLPDFVLGNLRAKLMVDGHDDNRYWMSSPSGKAKRQQDDMVPWAGTNESSAQDPWDLVYLDYRVDSPLDAIVHPSAEETYRTVFLFLFRLKRVEWMLNNSWRQSTALNHAILIEMQAGGADAPAIGEAAERSSFLLRGISSTRQAMLHFVSNLQSYLMFEVLEGGWEGLVQALSGARSLDDVVRAHDSYLAEILDKALLGNDGDGKNGNGRILESLLHRLLSIALRFGKFQDHIFTRSLAGLDRAAQTRRSVEERAERGDWGCTTLDREEGRVFLYLADAGLFEFLERTANEFDGALSDLLKTMSKQIDEVDYVNASMDDDQDESLGIPATRKNHDALPFLLFRLDFSGYYARRAREHRKKQKQKS